MKGWIVRWQYAGDHVREKAGVITVLSARKEPSQVKAFIENCYAVETYSLSEKLGLARYNKPSENPYPAQYASWWPGHMTCGHNPFIEALMADNIRLVSIADGEETLEFNILKPPPRQPI